MPNITHHSFLVTSCFEDRLDEAHKYAISLFGALVSPVSEETSNGFRSFAIFPDGSGDGWDESDGHDLKRGQFKAYLQQTHLAGDKSSYVDWVEIQYGNKSDLDTHVVADSDMFRREG